MKYLLVLLLLLGFNTAFAQGDPALDELEVEAQLEDEEYEDEEELNEAPRPRNPPAPMRPNRFRNSKSRFSPKRGGRSGGGVDRLGRTEGKVEFELADPPKYYKRKNRPYVMPPAN